MTANRTYRQKNVHLQALGQLAGVLLMGNALATHAGDIINTLPGYDQHSAWAATGPNATKLGTADRYGDNDIGWRFFNGGDAHFVNVIELPLSEVSWLNGRIADISIWTDTVVPLFEHVPGQLLESVRITAAPIGNPALCTVNFSGTNILSANTYYWVVLSVPGDEQMRWWQDEFALTDARGAWCKDGGVWQAPILGGNAGAMRVAGMVAPPPGPTHPVVTSIILTSGGFVLRGTNGGSLKSYCVLYATNLNMPTMEWTAVCTNTFDSTGAFDCTNSLPVDAPQGYFRLLCPGGP